MPEQTLSPETQIMQWITSKWITRPLYIVSELGIADLIQDGTTSVEALAEKTGTHAPTLYRVLRALSSVGIFVETDNRAFGLTPLSECLLSNALRPIARMFLSEWHDKAWNGLHHTIKTGEPAFDHSFGKPSFEWLEENPRERSILDQGQASKAIGFIQSILEFYDFTNFNTICDIGGGQGTFLLHLLSANPHLHGYVADLPEAVISANKEILKANLSQRCKAIPYDFLREAPPQCDAYFLVNILHDWEDEICIQVLKNISKAMNTKSKLWVVEYMLEPGTDFSVAKLLDIEVLVMSGGRERSLDEYKTLLKTAGVNVSKIMPLKSGPAMLECSK